MKSQLLIRNLLPVGHTSGAWENGLNITGAQGLFSETFSESMVEAREIDRKKINSLHPRLFIVLKFQQYAFHKNKLVILLIC